MVLGEQQPGGPVNLTELLQGIEQQALLEKLLLRPNRKSLGKRPQAFGSEGEIGFQKALELQERLVIKDDDIQIAKPDVLFTQAVLNGVDRQTRIVLSPR